MNFIRSASPKNVSDELNALKRTFKNITIVAGENDCSSNPNLTSSDEQIEHVETLFQL